MDSPSELTEQRIIAGLSEWETSGLTEASKGHGPPVPISVAEHGIVVETTHRERLQQQTLPPIVKFFIRANGATGTAIFLFALIEMFLPPAHVPIVTDKVLIAFISGITIQIGAVIIAAFRGLFEIPHPKPK